MDRLYKLLVPLIVVVVVVLVFLLAALLSPLFFGVEPSEDFDCDDGTLVVLDKLTRLGVSAKAVAGNLGMEGEEFWQIDHVWVIVNLPLHLELALDWGSPKLDRRYYEYLPITRQQLVEFVEQDQNDKKAPAGN